jgi:hypothetical protein
VDSNLPPETWITAAPQDTITTRDQTAQIGTIPFRFHVYWSGSDQDGAVSGFYWAVSETTMGVGGLPNPPLPGPKPQDYRYTTVRDSVFIFNVFEETNNRQHAFFIYAVDNKGKADATPARVIFNSLDRFPPIPVIDPESKATGTIFRPNLAWNGQGTAPAAAPIETTIALRDTFNRRTVVSDVLPINSVIELRWHSEVTVADNPAVAYKYKIGEGNEVEFVQVPASVTGTFYNTTDQNRLTPGLKVFTLRAIDQAGGARTSPETTRRFSLNLSPDTWFAGPEIVPSSNPAFYTIGYQIPNVPGSGIKERYRQIGTGSITPPAWVLNFPNSYLGQTGNSEYDSMRTMAAYRVPRKTFFEIYTEYNAQNVAQHRVYPHAEGDTVHMNSWILLHAGGFDPDSPYDSRVEVDNPPLVRHPVNTPVLNSGPANGSPIGFRFRIPVVLYQTGRPDSAGNEVTLTQSQVFPLSDPAVGFEPHIGAYQGMQQSGRAYALIRAEDGNGGLDNRIVDPVGLVDSVESGIIGPGHPRYHLRDKVLTFYVNRAPYLLQTWELNPATRFQPYEGQQIFGRTMSFTAEKVADDDPHRLSPVPPVGGPPLPIPRLFRFNVVLRGKLAGSNPARDTTYIPPHLSRSRVYEGIPPTGVTIQIPTYIEGPDVSVDIELCDCADCESIGGAGRCRRYPRINVVLAGPQPASPTSARISTGPGSSGESSRSNNP